ncbi:MAG TPA: hypothetical protein VGK59_05425 [Ohtaekwangia sp.]
MRFLFFLLLFYTSSAPAQLLDEEKNLVSQLNLSGGLPEKLLSTRTAVFHSYTFTPKELNDAQGYFQRSGIDALVYFETDRLIANADVTRTFSDYLLKREIANLIFLEKTESDYRIVITLFNGKESVVDPKQNAWTVSNTVFTEILKTVYRTTANQLKKQNMLVNDVPETDIQVNPILGKRNEFFAMDLKVDMLSVPKTGDPVIDQQLDEYFKANYPLKYKLTEPGLSDKELRKQGYLYVLRFIHTRGIAARELLGYNMTKSESALASVTYPNGQSVLKNIPSNTVIYKAYFKHIDSGNVFLGTKWDADISWDAALRNHIQGLKLEFRLN